MEALNEAIGEKFISVEDEKNTMIHAYILNNDLNPQVLRGWGDLYIEEIGPNEDNDNNREFHCSTNGSLQSQNIDIPMGNNEIQKMTVYKTGYTGQILPDGRINVLENDCRFIMNGFFGLDAFENINEVDRVLRSWEGIEGVRLDIQYAKGHHRIVAHITGKEEPDKEKLIDYLKSKLSKESLIPADILFHPLIQKK